MMDIAEEEIALAFTGFVYLVAVALYAWWITRSADALLRVIKAHEPAELWNELGAPASMKEAIQDPHRRWRRFMRSATYRNRCPPEIAARIDAFRLSTNLELGALAICGAIILYLFWPLPIGA